MPPKAASDTESDWGDVACAAASVFCISEKSSCWKNIDDPSRQWESSWKNLGDPNSRWESYWEGLSSLSRKYKTCWEICSSFSVRNDILSPAVAQREASPLGAVTLQFLSKSFGSKGKSKGIRSGWSEEETSISLPVIFATAVEAIRVRV